jgi:hypothetical protein
MLKELELIITIEYFGNNRQLKMVSLYFFQNYVTVEC